MPGGPAHPPARPANPRARPARPRAPPGTPASRAATPTHRSGPPPRSAAATPARPADPGTALAEPPFENDDLFGAHERSGAPQFRVYEPQQRVIVMGASGSAEADVDLAAARAAGIPIRRRRGGGGTVLLTPGQVVVALVTTVARPYHSREYAQTINGWLAAALTGAGVRGVEPRGISDLAIGERKIVGTSVFRRRLVLFYQASLLVANDAAEFERYLTYPAQVPDYRRGRSHREFCHHPECRGLSAGGGRGA